MIRTGTVQILNGTEMYKNFKETHFLEPELMIPFNEAMCYGAACEDLFSDEFTEIRAKVHHVTPAQYAEITLNPLEPVFCGNFDHIALWFDEDMFCQINLLTILAWLDQTDYKGSVDLHLVGEHFQPVNYYSLKVKGYYQLYKQVVIHETSPQKVYPSPLNMGIELYLNYLKKDSDLMLYIQKHQEVPIKELVPLLIDNFKDYGLGDTQYAEIIKSYRQNQ
ncbi:AraC family transcriptional regulator [Halobacillus sp. Marseille-P3879]|uniref:AraC family transcriptional regulator n=1 Tax=Halobacillus sp. Marseille-P3879 TaxID=2045014 RepID=UPI000C7E4FF8|nr:AraC family transcriptional regulator [Halobacillus sp. Marseille-P3879]